MTREVERCRKAVEIARTVKKVAMVSGGDPGIYAMAGLIFELLRETGWGAERQHVLSDASEKESRDRGHIEVEVIPGISALNACASRLGAPLMHDFASVSLSDRLTPWNLIEKRLAAAAMADFVIVLYNPRSKGRRDHISRAREILLGYRSPETPVGIVRAAMRTDETVVVTDLGHMLDHEIDMQTTVLVGNSKTFVWKGWMVTPRGYRVGAE